MSLHVCLFILNIIIYTLWRQEKREKKKKKKKGGDVL